MKRTKRIDNGNAFNVFNTFIYFLFFVLYLFSKAIDLWRNCFNFIYGQKISEIFILVFILNFVLL